MEDIINIAIKAAIAGGDEILKVYHSNDFKIEIKPDDSPVTLADKKSTEAINPILEQTTIPILGEEDEEVPYTTRKNWRKLWIVDPLDGTKEFIKKNDEFAVNIGLVENKKPVLGVIYIPATQEVFVGGKTIGAFKFFKHDFVSSNFRETNTIRLPHYQTKQFVITGSRSHTSPETADFVKKIKEKHPNCQYVGVGSSIKFCRLAEGKINLYPRFQLCMEWDTAAGHALLQGVGKDVVTTDTLKPLVYNKKSLYSPFFIAG